ncbi:MAG: diguanylate cyclase, partial [Thermotogaceae bacterium]|nr:diguanylate cyclase [Thermotogaceae bacterium]
SKEWHFVAWHASYDKDDLLKIATLLEDEKENNIHEVLRSKDVLVINNIKKYEKWKKIGKASVLSSWLGIPLISNDKVLGVISIDYMEKTKLNKWQRIVARKLLDDLKIINEAYRDIISVIYEPNVDPVTKNLNKNALEIDLKKYSRKFRSLGIIYIKITNFDRLVKAYGQTVVVEAVIKFVEKLQEMVRDKGKIYTISLKEHTILAPDPIPGFLLSLKKRISAEFLKVMDVG